MDTTVDTGHRTIGFKLTDKRGEPMARYGSTVLATGRWYHIASVYYAKAKTIDVYLDAKLDNGSLLGAVSEKQHSSRKPVLIGRRGSVSGFEFAGAIDDVRIYSVALTPLQIEKVMRGADIDLSRQSQAFSPGLNRERRRVDTIDSGEAGAVLTDHEDACLPAAASLLRVLVAVVISSLWPVRRRWFPLLASFVGGMLLVATTAEDLPSFDLVMIPLISLVGGASVSFSLFHPNQGCDRPF